jgi:uncharacterized phage protein gp47/JayE
MPTPATIPISKTLDQVRSELFGRIEEVQDEYQAKGWLPNRLNLNKGVVRGLLEVYAWGLWQLYRLLMATLPEAFPETATADWLDLHADQIVVPRREATKALGLVAFRRSEASAATGGNVRIPAGRIVRTRPDGKGVVYRYVTSADAVLPAGAVQVLVPVEAEEYGREANATAGQICELVTTVPGVESVTNAADWLISEGADTETDASLQKRYVLKWQANQGLTKYGYESWALEVTGVIAAAILDQHPRGQGTVDVVVKGSAGMPTTALLDKVRARVAEDAPQNDDWLVKAPTAVPVTIEATLEIVSGTEALTLAEAESRIRALFEDPSDVVGINPLQIGEDLPRDRLVAALMAVAGVKRVVWTSPTADVAVSGDGLAVLESLNIGAVWAGEI